MQTLDTAKSQTIDTTSALVSQECFQERVFFSVVNTSTGGQVISLTFGQEAKASQGIVLYPGGYYSESKDAQPITQRQIQAISSAAGGAIAVQERIYMKGAG